MQSSTHFVSLQRAAFRSQTNGSRPPLGKGQQLFSAKSWWTISRAFCLRLPVPTVTSIARLASYEPKHLSSMFPLPLAFLKPAPCLPPVCVANNMMRKGLPPSSSPSLGWSRNSGLMSFSACDSSFCPSTVHRIRWRPLAITVWSKVPGLKGSAKKAAGWGSEKWSYFFLPAFQLRLPRLERKLGAPALMEPPTSVHNKFRNKFLNRAENIKAFQIPETSQNLPKPYKHLKPYKPETLKAWTSKMVRVFFIIHLASKKLPVS